MNYWSVYCVEHDCPGLWQTWESQQVATVGYPPHPGGELHGHRRKSSWTYLVRCFEKMRAGDAIVARLQGNRIGRVGQVLGVRYKLKCWKPLVPKSPRFPRGEQGRHILVRWDFKIGPPLGSGLGCLIPKDSGKQLSSGKLRKAIAQIDERDFRAFENLLKDESTWTGVSGSQFAQERALSEYIAKYPEQLRQGLRAYPMVKGLEKVAGKTRKGKGRLDVLLLDSDQKTPIVVECEQHAPRLADLKQLKGYMKAIRKELGERAKGILVFAGSPNIDGKVRKAARKARIELYAYRLNVDFLPSHVR